MSDRDLAGSPVPGEVTALLRALGAGDATAQERLLAVVYAELKAIARQVFRRERGNHTLQPTALVHEAWVKLAGGAATSFRDRAHFFAVASQAMRQVLVDHARGRAADKRGGGAERLQLVEELVPAPDVGPTFADVLAVDEALSRFAAHDPERARLVELRFFGGLTLEEAAEVLGVSVPTVKRDWRVARAFLARELAGG
jgi:RNA polymerase sigma factor (TIGR02999 family)